MSAWSDEEKMRAVKACQMASPDRHTEEDVERFVKSALRGAGGSVVVQRVYDERKFVAHVSSASRDGVLIV